MMTTKQLIIILIAFVFALFVLSLPLWLDTALPILKDSFNGEKDILENWYVFLKFFAGHIADIFVRIYEKFVLGAD